MNRRQADGPRPPTPRPIPTPRRAGEGRIVRRQTVDQGRYQNRAKADADADPPATKGLIAIDQSAPRIIRHLQIGVTDHAVQPKSP
jgi:hypothetical protein